MIPFVIPVRHKLFGHYHGFAFFLFIFYWRNIKDNAVLIRHERIHFYQQLELLFCFHWLLYGVFYAIARLRGATHDYAYRNNPFEREAYTHEDDPVYINNRRPFAWVKFIRRREKTGA